MERKKYKNLDILPPGQVDIEAYIDFLIKIFKISYDKE